MKEKDPSQQEAPGSMDEDMPALEDVSEVMEDPPQQEPPGLPSTAPSNTWEPSAIFYGPQTTNCLNLPTKVTEIPSARMKVLNLWIWHIGTYGGCRTS